MPHITAKQYEMVKHILEPKPPQNRPEQISLRNRIFALNKKIRSVPGNSPTPEWRVLMAQHAQLEAAYQMTQMEQS